MLLSINKDAELSIELDKRFKKYLLSLKIRSKYFNYDAYSKIRYENIISIIENIENMIFSKHRCVDNIYLNKIEFNFEQSRTAIKVYINISDNQQYSVTLSRENVINLYNYLVNYIKTFNKIQMTDFDKKYTYVEVRYVDRAGTKCLAVVVNRAEYYYEQAPYPVLETKRVIKIVTSADEYKS